MATVPLEFAPPNDEDIVKLYVLEAPAKNGPFVVIDSTLVVGTYPTYINHFSTQLATSALDWFAIQWEDSKGAKSAVSAAIQGGVETLVGVIVDRVLQRDHSLNKGVVIQEAEAAIQSYFGTSTDPYDPTLVANYRVKAGLTYLVLARVLIAQALLSSSSGIDSATLGLVSFKSSVQSAVSKDLQGLIDLANTELGISGSHVFQLDELTDAVYLTYDHSRLVSGWLAIE